MQHFGAPKQSSQYAQNYGLNTQNSFHQSSLGGSNQGFMNANSMTNAFAMNGNALGLPGGFGGGSGLGMAGGTGLASQSAQMGFANAQSQGHNGMGESGSRGSKKGRIREVWKHNLQEEIKMLRDLVDDYPYIAMVRRELFDEGKIG